MNMMVHTLSASKCIVEAVCNATIRIRIGMQVSNSGCRRNLQAALPMLFRGSTVVELPDEAARFVS
jgi:hypothetical protein